MNLVIDDTEAKRASTVKMPVRFMIDCTFWVNGLNEVITQEIKGVRMGMQAEAMKDMTEEQKEYLRQWAEREAPGLAIVLAKEIIHNASDAARDYHLERGLKAASEAGVKEINKGVIVHGAQSNEEEKK